MSTATPAGPSEPELPGGIRHQMVLWWEEVGVLQPLLEQRHVREVVRDALQRVQGEEATVVESGRLVEVLVLNRLMAPRPLYRVGEWLAGSVLAHRRRLDPTPANRARPGPPPPALDAATHPPCPP